jgi:myo-inositol 2-dehydrogenase/D-chiro-inositol 1-dehydrogenase
MIRTICVGVVGCGRIGRLHCENLAHLVEGVELVGVADHRLDVAQEVAASCPKARAYDDPRRLLQDDSVDAIVIASPTDTHAKLIWEAAARGKHIFCEKPVDVDLVRARAAVSSAERAGVVMQVGFNRRFDPTFARIAGAVRAGDIGAVHVVRITSRDPAPPPAAYLRSSGGLFLDMTIHDLDMARFVGGDEPETVFAAGSALIDPGVGRAGDVDTAAVVLHYRNGALALIDNSRRAVYGYDQRVEVFGSKGCLTSANPARTEVALWDERGVRGDGPLDFFLERYRESYVAEMKAFVDSVRDDRPAAIDGEDGIKAIELAIAAQRSCREGRPVRIHEVAAKSEAA